MRASSSSSRAALAALSLWLELSLALSSCGAQAARQGRAGPGRPPGSPARRAAPHLGLVGLLQLQPVQPHLLLVLAAQLLQRAGHLQVVLLLPAAVHLHQAALLPPPRLPHLLLEGTGDRGRARKAARARAPAGSRASSVRTRPGGPQVEGR